MENSADKSRYDPNKQYIWMEVTQDELSLPLATATSALALERALGLKKGTIHTYMCKFKKRGRGYPKYIRVELEDDDG